MSWLFENKLCKKKWKWRLAENERKKITAETLIIKYAIRGFERHLPYAVADVLFFVLLLRELFENKGWTKIKLKVSR